MTREVSHVCVPVNLHTAFSVEIIFSQFLLSFNIFLTYSCSM